MNEKKYVFTNETIVVGSHTLRRIQAVKNFENVLAGDFGGYIEKEENLSHEGTCWVYNNAIVFDEARVYGEALICDEARVCGEAVIYGEAQVYGNAVICGEAHVYDEAQVCGNAVIYGEARVYGKANIVNQYDILCIPNIGSRKDTITFFNTRCGKIYVACGYFKGTIEEFENAVEKTHGNNEQGKAYKFAVTMAKQYLHIV